MISTRLIPSALTAVLALAASGCGPGKSTASPAGSAASNSVSGSVAPSPVSAVKNLVTSETAGKPILNLKLGEPVGFQKGGVTLTITPQSPVKLAGDPPDLSDSSRDENCGAWWKLTYEIVVDAQPNATWKDWAVEFNGFAELQKGTMGDEYDHVPAGDPGSGPDRLINVTLPAEAERRQNPGAPYHKVLESKEYFDMCTDALSGKPSGREPLGVELSISRVRAGERETTIARWLR